MRIPLRQACNRLMRVNFKYKGKTITYRTSQTMRENGTFKTSKKVGQIWTVEESEVESMEKGALDKSIMDAVNLYMKQETENGI